MSEATTKARKPNVGGDPTAGSRVRLWQVGLYAFAIGASAILLLVNLILILSGSFSAMLLIFALFVSGLSWGLVFKKRTEFVDPTGIKVASSEPEFVAFVHQVASAVQAPTPDAIYLVAEAELELVEATRYFGLKQDKTILTVGVPMLRGLDRQEFAALLAHEFAHTAPTDVRHGARALRALRAAQALIAIERQGFVNGVYGSYARKMFRSVGGVGVAQEQAAEELAAVAFGTEALTSALGKYDDMVVAYDQLLRDYVVPALQNQTHPTEMFAGFAEILQSESRATARVADVEKRQAQERNEFVLHRTPVERLASLKAAGPVAPAIELERSGDSAATLLDPDQKSEVIVVGTWASKLMSNRTEPRSWEDLAEQVYSAKSRNIATAAFSSDDDSDASDIFDQALTWSAAGDWNRVDEAVAKPLKKLDSDHDRRVEWARCVVVEAAASTDQFDWQHNWDGAPKLVDTSGTCFDAACIAEMIATGRADDARTTFESAIR